MLSTPERRARGAVRVASSLDEMLADVDETSPFKPSDSRSGSGFEKVISGGVPMIVKYLCVDDDWIMRGTGDLNCRALTLIQAGVMDDLPECIDHTMVATAPYRSRHGHRGAALLMRDVGDLLVPPGDTVIAHGSHRRYLENMATLHARWWGRAEAVDIFPLAHHYTFLTPTMATIEAELGGSDPVPKAVREGWAALHRVSPRMAATLAAVAADPGPLVSALRATPFTLVHGDWKLGNLGEHADGRTVLLDWDRTGAAPATLDLAWYLAINSARLPETKEDAITAYREALERHGVTTVGWWDRQLALTLLGAAVQLGWNKAGEPEELGWWQDRVTEGERYLA